MEYTCAEDLQQVAVAYCACMYPLPPLCKVHAEKHSSALSGFHFSLPLSANEFITSEEMYMEVTEWLLRLNNNCKLLRKKLSQVANGESLIESAYQELLHSASEANAAFKQRFSVMKENFSAEVENAIQKTRVHALEQHYTPVTPLEKLLWNNKPREIPNLLFSFQAKCVKEEIPNAFRVTFQCTLPGLEQFNLEGRHLLPELKDPLGANQREKLNEDNQRIQLLEKELQALRTDFSVLKEQNTSLNRKLQTQTHELDNAVDANTDLEKKLAGARSELQVCKVTDICFGVIFTILAIVLLLVFQSFLPGDDSHEPTRWTHYY